MHDEQRPRSPEELRRANLRLALILASAALLFAVGFVVRLKVFGG